MFQFRRFPSYTYFIQYMMTGLDSGRIAPFGNLRIYCSLTAPRSLSQFVASFFGSWCQGIPLALFVAWPFLLWDYHWFYLSSWNCSNYYLCLNELTFSLILRITLLLFSFICFIQFSKCLVGLSGLEPPTSRLSGVRSNRLSYKPMSSVRLLKPMFRTLVLWWR